MLSEQARQDWDGFLDQLRPEGSAPLRRHGLNQFLIGVHRRGERLYAQDFKVLLDETPLDGEEREALVDFVEPALALLMAYDHVLRLDADEDEDEDVDMEDFVVTNEDDLPPGTFVI